MTFDNSTDITISEYKKGSKQNLECGGPTMGYCDRKVGVCVCADSYGSSNGSNAPGTGLYCQRKRLLQRCSGLTYRVAWRLRISTLTTTIGRGEI